MTTKIMQGVRLNIGILVLLKLRGPLLNMEIVEVFSHRKYFHVVFLLFLNRRVQKLSLKDLLSITKHPFSITPVSSETLGPDQINC